MTATVRRAWCGATLVVLASAAGVPAAAQDTIPPVEQGVRLGITYTPGMRPGMLVLSGPRREFLDSVRAILQRDLEYSDRFEMIFLPGGDSLVLGVRQSESGDGADAGPRGEPYVNYSLYGALGADFAVSVLGETDSTFSINLYDVRGEATRARVPFAEADPTTPAFRMAVHQAADRLVREATGEPGYAASRIVFESRGRIFSVDADGAALRPISRAGVKTYSPVWDPAGRRVAYTELREDGWGSIVIQEPGAERIRRVEPTGQYLNYTPAFSPDGRILAFTRSWEEGTDLFAYNLAQDCCLQRLTVGRFSDNLSPVFSPDGSRIAFESNRGGLPQIYVMAADGADQELFAPYDYGVTGTSHSPEWSPDALNLAFHRTVDGTQQLFVMDVRTQVVRQLTSMGRNEDPTWAPDGRHIGFKSSRTGAEQIWVLDIETGRVRQLTRVGAARMPNWSAHLTAANEP